MKIFKKCQMALIVTLVMAINGYAGQGASVQPKFSINVKLKGNKPSGNDSLSIQYFKPYHPLGLPSFRPGKDHYLLTDKDGHVEFKLPSFDEPMMMIISLVYHGGLRLNSDLPDRVTSIGTFLVEKDDDIVINIVRTGKHSNDSITFTGKGVEKYITALELYKLCDMNFSKGEHIDELHKLYYPNGKRDETDLGNKIDQYSLITERLLKKKAIIIERSGMSPKMKKLSAYNFAPIFDSWVFRMQAYYKRYSSNPKLLAILKKNIEKYTEQFRYPYDPLMALAPWYSAKLAFTEYNLRLMQGEMAKIKFQNIYEIFKNKYSGALRELLIANFFMKGYGWRGTEALSPHLVDSLMQDGAQYLSTPIIKDAYATKLKLTGGTTIFNGKFKDQYGKEVSIVSLKGKVIFIDFWFTGCGACMIFHKNFHKEGYPLIKDNKDFVYVSISIDQKKSIWLKSVANGNYSSNDYLNLNAELGLNDPFLKYYQRNALPFMILVDKNGKIYSSSIVPEPKAVVQLIEEALRITYQL